MACLETYFIHLQEYVRLTILLCLCVYMPILLKSLIFSNKLDVFFVKSLIGVAPQSVILSTFDFNRMLSDLYHSCL